MNWNLEHPDITRVNLTGHTSDYESHYCEECGKCLDDEDEYEDITHKYLCMDCLLSLHKKWW